MPQVDILIQGRSYAVQCAEGEEKRAHFLAAHINRHAARLVARLGAMPDAQLLLMTGMTVADELMESREKLQQLQGEPQQAQTQEQEQEEDLPLPLGKGQDAPASEAENQAGDALAARIDATSRRLERIAGMLDPQAAAPESPDLTQEAESNQAGE